MSDPLTTMFGPKPCRKCGRDHYKGACPEVAATPRSGIAFAVESGVPVPGGSKPRPLGAVALAFRALGEAAVGASVFFPDPTRQPAIQQAAYRYGGGGWVITRRVEGGWRVWKVSEPKVRQ